MRAVYYEKFTTLPTIENVPDPSPSPTGVVVKVEATGLCRSDWHGWMGHDPDIKLPHVPGHELAGTIHAVGRDVKTLKVGDRVTVPFVSGCGHCPQCAAGQQQICDNQVQPVIFGAPRENKRFLEVDLSVRIERNWATIEQSREVTPEKRIVEALETVNWNKVRAAVVLGMPRRTLYRRLKEYGLLDE